MSKLQELIQELCPNGVEYKKLGEIVIIKNGRDYKHLGKGNIPVYGSGGIMTYVDTYAYNKPTVLIPRKGSLGNLFYVDKPFWNVDTVFYTQIDENKMIAKYLYYTLAKEHLENLNNAGGVPSLTQAILNKVIIPVPPLDVQNEIVRMLDCFTLLTAELTAELTARRKQYEYYRDALLTPPFSSTGSLTEARLQSEVEGTYSTEVVYKKLGEIATITRGGNFQKKDFVENGLPCIHYGQMYTHFGTWTDKTLTFVSKEVFEKSKKADTNDIVMAVTSENVEDVCKCTAWIGNEPIAVSGHTAIIHHNQNAKYLSYYFQSSSFYSQKVKLAHGTKVIEVTPDKLKDIAIPIPPLPVQERIVNVLDNFDAICSDLKIGLPAEIDARKKQYEYYRDLLLNFEPLGTVLAQASKQASKQASSN